MKKVGEKYCGKQTIEREMDERERERERKKATGIKRQWKGRDIEKEEIFPATKDKKAGWKKKEARRLGR